MHEMEHVLTTGYLINGFSALVIGYGVDRYIARRGSANFGYKLVMVAAHGGWSGVPVVHGIRLRIHGHRRDVRLSGIDGRILAGVYAMSQILAGARRRAAEWLDLGGTGDDARRSPDSSSNAPATLRSPSSPPPS